MLVRSRWDPDVIPPMQSCIQVRDRCDEDGILVGYWRNTSSIPLRGRPVHSWCNDGAMRVGYWCVTDASDAGAIPVRYRCVGCQYNASGMPLGYRCNTNPWDTGAMSMLGYQCNTSASDAGVMSMLRVLVQYRGFECRCDTIEISK